MSKKGAGLAGALQSDADFGTPKHDAICLWVQAEAERLFGSAADAEAAREREVTYRGLSATSKERLYAWESANRRPPNHVSVAWEQPVSKSAYAGPQIVGYVDLTVETTAYAPLDRSGRDEFGWQAVRVTSIVEVKSTIRSLGELFRQLRTYSGYLGLVDNRRLFVVTPDTRFRSLIEEQGFSFIESPADLDVGRKD